MKRTNKNIYAPPDIVIDKDGKIFLFTMSNEQEDDNEFSFNDFGGIL